MKDVLIVGGGPAGSALAIQLGRRGVTVDLIDQSHFPRDKPCGEGILPGGVEVLQALGLRNAVAGQVLLGVGYHVGSHCVRGTFGRRSDGSQRVGIGQRRHLVDNLLWHAAAETEGVEAHQGVTAAHALVESGRAVGVVAGGIERRARWIVGADGSSSALRRTLGLERVKEPRRVGIRAHFCGISARLEEIQVFMRPGYELYVTPLPDRQLLVAALTEQRNAAHLRRHFWSWCSREPLLREWLHGATQSSPLVGRSALHRYLAPGSLPEGLSFIGDAAASSDPITAGGISLALRDAELLAKTLPDMIRGDRSAQRQFTRLQKSAIRTHHLLGGALLFLSRKPRAAELACKFLGSFPWAMNALVGAAAR